MDKQIKLIKEQIQSRLEQLPRAIKGKAPRAALLKICDEIDSYQAILETLDAKH